MKVITPKLDALTCHTLRRAVPEGLTVSAWIRLMVDVLVSFPAASEARSELKDAVENPYRRDGHEPRSGPHKVHFRVREDWWLALGTMAAEAGLSRMDYLRRLIYMGSMYRGGWYPRYKAEEVTR